MAVKLGVDTALASADAAMALVNAGATPGKLLVYDGTAPATPADAVTTQVLLVSFDLANPAFLSAVDGVSGGRAVLDTVPSSSALADGDAAWFRIVDGNDRVIIQGSVTASAGGGDVIISSVSLTEDIEVSIVSFAYVQPKG